MSYKLTTTTDITNAGYNTEVKEFDTFDELQDYMQAKEQELSTEEYELFSYNSRITEEGEQ